MRTFRLLTLLGLLLGSTRARGEGDLSAAPRVVVLDMALQGVSGSDASELPDFIGLKLTKNRYAVVRSGELHRVLAETPGLPSGCERDDACRRRLGALLLADYVLAPALSREKKRLRIEFTLLRMSGEPARQSTSETMRRRESLAMNVDLCLRRLLPFPAPEVPRPAPAPEPPAPTIAPAPVPTPPAAVPTQEASAPAEEPTAKPQCRFDRDCAALASDAGLDPGCFSTAWRGLEQNTCLSCLQGVCSCSEDRTSCGHGIGCVNLQNDPEHCGHCARSCAAGAACVAGECR